VVEVEVENDAAEVHLARVAVTRPSLLFEPRGIMTDSKRKIVPLKGSKSKPVSCFFLRARLHEVTLFNGFVQLNPGQRTILELFPTKTRLDVPGPEADKLADGQETETNEDVLQPSAASSPSTFPSSTAVSTSCVIYHIHKRFHNSDLRWGHSHTPQTISHI